MTLSCMKEKKKKKRCWAVLVCEWETCHVIVKRNEATRWALWEQTTAGPSLGCLVLFDAAVALPFWA